MLVLDTGDLVVGTGSGHLSWVEQTRVKRMSQGNMVSDPTSPCLVERKVTKVGSKVTSMMLDHSNTDILLATDQAHIVKVTLLTFAKTTLITSPSSNIK